jgi:hypothetical protein
MDVALIRKTKIVIPAIPVFKYRSYNPTVLGRKQ